MSAVITPFKVIYGHRFWYQIKVRMSFPIILRPFYHSFQSIVVASGHASLVARTCWLSRGDLCCLGGWSMSAGCCLAIVSRVEVVGLSTSSSHVKVKVKVNVYLYSASS